MEWMGEPEREPEGAVRANRPWPEAARFLFLEDGANLSSKRDLNSVQYLS
jgi:hypothetical protein